MIKNLNAILPELGRIKTGIKGAEITSAKGNLFRPPMKLDHFILTTMERDANGDLVQDTELMDALKKSKDAKVNKDGNLTGIPIRLLYNDIQLNFPNRLSCYSGGKCICSGDGETAHTRDGRDIKCPCEKLDFGYEGKEKCKYNGKLYCVIDGTTSIGACHVLRTTSINTVQSIIGGLSFVQAAAGGMLAFLPLQLVLTPKTTVTPGGAPVTVYISSIVYNGSIGDLRQAALGMAKERATYMIEMDQVEESAKQLMMTVVESDEEQKEVNEEFYPDSIDLPVVDAEVIAAIQEDNAKREEKKVEPEKKFETKPENEPEKETDISDLKEPVPITEDQVKEVKKLKKKLGIKKPEWLKMIGGIVSGVESVMDFTTEEAASLIKKLVGMDAEEPETEVPETEKHSEFESTAGPMTDEQKRMIIKRKKSLKITDKATWEKFIGNVFPGVTSVLGLTSVEADKFIEYLNKTDDVPW